MRITIIGASEFGISVAEALLSAKHEILIIDKNTEVVDKLNSRLDIQTLNVNAKDLDSLRELDVDRSDVVIACTDDDDKNLVLCKIAKALGVGINIARLHSPEYIEHEDFIKNAMSVDYVVNPDYACANEIFKHITQHYSLGTGYELYNGIALSEFSAAKIPGFAGQELKHGSALLGGLLVAAISRKGNVIIPNGNTVIDSDDSIYAIGDAASARKLRKIIGKENVSSDIKRVMIAGGGKTAYMLAKMLLDENISVSIIEKDTERAKKLAVKLDKASVINGDATDQELLYEEGLDEMDAFAACMDSDEKNIIVTLLAGQHGVKKLSAKITKTNYAPILENLGDIMTINPVALCATTVLRQLSDDTVVFSKLIQGQAEFTEMVISADMPIVGKEIREMNIPDGILIGAIYRNNELIVPNGSTKILGDDRVVFFTLLSKIAELNKLIKGDNGEF